MRSLLMAIGGNALMRPEEPASIGAERTRVAEVCRSIAEVARAGWRIVITHGNGPQVGAALLRSERAAAETYPLPLDACVASTQGEIGALLQQGLATALRAQGVQRPVVALLTQVVVDPDDRGFARPTKPIGPWYTSEAAAARQAAGWTMTEDSRHRWRRVVPSPAPLEIVEERIVRTLVDADVLVITLGGGGIPVIRQRCGFTSVEAVVDKDLASALLAIRLDVDCFVLATDVDRIYLDFGTSQARGLGEVTVDELRAYAAAGHFPPGSMGPKIEAALRYVETVGRDAIVTSYDGLALALDGRAGTHVRAPACVASPARPCARSMAG